MTPEMVVRKLSASHDLSSATKLLQRFFYEEGFGTPAAEIERNTKALASIEQCGLFIVESHSACIAVATVSMEFGIEFGWSAEMGDLYVLPEWRGKGISRKLVEAVEEFLGQKGVSSYQVTVTPFAEQHHGLATFYRSLGFVGEGRQLMHKSLRSTA